MTADYEIYRPTDHPSPERHARGAVTAAARAERPPARAVCLLAGPIDLFGVPAPSAWRSG